MKVWRGFTLTIWVALLAACTAFALLYHALSATVLDADKTKERLANSQAYDTIRDTLLVNRVVDGLSEQYPGNKLVDRSMISEILAAVLPRQTLAERLDPARATSPWRRRRRKRLLRQPRPPSSAMTSSSSSAPTTNQPKNPSQPAGGFSISYGGEGEIAGKPFSVSLRRTLPFESLSREEK